MMLPLKRSSKSKQKGKCIRQQEFPKDPIHYDRGPFLQFLGIIYVLKTTSVLLLHFLSEFLCIFYYMEVLSVVILGNGI